MSGKPKEQRRSEKEADREARDLQARIDAEQETRRIERLLARYPLSTEQGDQKEETP